MPPPPRCPSLLRCGTRTANGNITCKNSAHICKLVSGVGSAVSRAPGTWARDERSRDGAWELSHTVSTWRVLWQRDGAQTECRWGVIFGNYVTEWVTEGAMAHWWSPSPTSEYSSAEPPCCCAGARLLRPRHSASVKKWISSHLLL